MNSIQIMKDFFMIYWLIIGRSMKPSTGRLSQPWMIWLINGRTKTPCNILTLISKKQFEKQVKFHVLHQFSFFGFLDEVEEGDYSIFGISVDVDDLTSLFEHVLRNMAGQEVRSEYSIGYLLNSLRGKNINQRKHVVRELGAVVF